jgi:hypothetical protein
METVLICALFIVMRFHAACFLPPLGHPATEVVHLLHRRRAVDDMET